MKMTAKIKLIILSIGFFMIANVGFAQEDTTVVTEENVVTEDEGNLPVRSPWNTALLIDNQTTETPSAKSLEFSIHHRFGKIKELSNLYGIYASSNIRLGINYGITEKLSVGFGTEKDSKMQEFQGKYRIISQTRNGKIPVSVTYFGNIVIDATEEANFGINYEFKNRLSFFNQIIIGRKFTDALSVQFAASYSHYNAIKETGQNANGDTIGLWKNDYAGLMIGGRYKITDVMSAIIEYHYPISVNKPWEGQNEPLPNIGIGLEMGTSTHAFQVFASQYRGIIAQQNYSRNLNDMAFEGWCFGFNITVRF